jgi:hypothetical protein
MLAASVGNGNLPLRAWATRYLIQGIGWAPHARGGEQVRLMLAHPVGEGPVTALDPDLVGKGDGVNPTAGPRGLPAS